jgi:hypothetical protein
VSSHAYRVKRTPNTSQVVVLEKKIHSDDIMARDITVMKLYIFSGERVEIDAR